MGIPAEVFQDGNRINTVEGKIVHHDSFRGREVEIRDIGTTGAKLIYSNSSEEEVKNKEHFPIKLHVDDSIGLDSGLVVIGTKD